MKALILAAGFAKRLFPYVKSIPKPLLPIAGEPLIEGILSKIEETGCFQTVYIVTNDVFIENFNDWKRRLKTNLEIILFNDGVESDQECKGAVGDIGETINHFYPTGIEEPLVVIGGDNYFEFKLWGLINAFNENKNNTTIALHHVSEENKKLLSQYGVVETNTENKITSFEEKPSIPKSMLASTACYIFSKEALEKLKHFHSDEKHNKDNLGSFIKYLMDEETPLYGHVFQEEWVDIGDYDQYLALNQKKINAKFKKDENFRENIDAIVFFADIIGSVSISEHATDMDYDEFISEFQDIALKVIEQTLQKGTVAKSDFQSNDLLLMLLNKKIIKNIDCDPDRVCFDDSIMDEVQLRKRLDQVRGIKSESVLAIWQQCPKTSYGSIYNKEDRCFLEFSVRGDEAVLILYTKNRKRDIRTIIDVAIELKRKWFLSPFNRNRIKEGRDFYDIGIGIHYGRVMLAKHPMIKKDYKKSCEFNAEGYSINLTKRIEGESRKGHFSKIMVSKPFKDVLDVYFPKISLKFSDRIDTSFKGIYGSYPLFELQMDAEVEEAQKLRQIKANEIDYYVAAYEKRNYDMWLLMRVARYFYDQEKYIYAQRYYMDAIGRVGDFLPALTYLGRSYYRLNLFMEAEEWFSKAYNLNDDSHIINNFLAINYRRRGFTDREYYKLSIEHHEKAIAFGSGYPFAYNAYAYTIAEAYTGNVESDKEYNLDRALALLEKSEKSFQERDTYPFKNLCHITCHTRGLIKSKKGNFDEAIQCFKSAISDLDRNMKIMKINRGSKKAEIAYNCGIAYFKKARALDDNERNKYMRISLKYFNESLSAPLADKDHGRDYYWFKPAEKVYIEEIKKELR